MREQRSGVTEALRGGKKDALTEIHRLVAFWTFGRHDPAETKRRGGGEEVAFGRSAGARCVCVRRGHTSQDGGDGDAGGGDGGGGGDVMLAGEGTRRALLPLPHLNSHAPDDIMPMSLNIQCGDDVYAHLELSHFCTETVCYKNMIRVQKE